MKNESVAYPSCYTVTEADSDAAFFVQLLDTLEWLATEKKKKLKILKY